MEAAIYMRESDDILFIRAQGHITAAHCPEIRERAFDRLESTQGPKDVRLDLSTCEYMDSTFLGLIVGINKRFQKYAKRPIRLYGPNETCMSLLKTMGIASLLSIESTIPDFPNPMENVLSKHQATAELLMDAHADLMHISEENKQRFSALYSILQNAAQEEKDEEK